jgi:surface protein
VGRVSVANSGDSAITSFTLSDTTNFEINGSGVIKTKTALDYETAQSYSLSVTATNSAGESAPVNVTIDVNDIDEIAPEVTISDDVDGVLGVTLVGQDWVADRVTFTFLFTESVTGFDKEDVVVSGGTKGTFSGSGDTYTLEVTPLSLNSKTPIHVSVPSDVVVDTSGNGNIGSAQVVQEVNTQKAFITVWKTDNPGLSGNSQIKILTRGDGYNFNIDWGDGNSDENVTESITHTYDAADTYTVKITGDFPRSYFAPHRYEWVCDRYGCRLIITRFNSDSFKLLSIEQWGTIKWQSMERAFSECRSMEGNFIDRPDLSAVNTMSLMFYKAAVFNVDISSWDVSKVTDMSGMFSAASNFSQDLYDWNISNVTDMNHMFNGAKNFNGDINSWDVSNVTNMLNMFNEAKNFNGDIGGWDVSGVTNMSGMFRSATSFNKDLSTWDVSRVTNMSGMFRSATSFNKDLSTWDVSSVTNM